MLNIAKYKRNPVVHYPEREWPDKEIEKAPIWCSVDFKEIEIGFPAASQIEYDFKTAGRASSHSG